jgi:hypothetical protein
MIFLLFLASVATIEVILRHDEGKKRKIKPPSSTVSEYDVASGPTAQSVLALMNTLDRHGRGQAPAVDPEGVSKNADQASLAIIRKDV